MDPNAVPPVTQPVASPTPPVVTPPTQSPSPWLLLLPAIIFATIAGYLFFKNLTLTRQLAALPSPTPTSSADPTSDWQTYQNDLGFSFKYPPLFLLNSSIKGSNQNVIFINVKNLSDYTDAPLGYDLKTALDDQSSLENNTFGYTYGSIPKSQQIKKLSDNISVKTFTILQQLEVCDVQFTRTAIFYYNNHQIVITVSAPHTLIGEMPEYFTTDEHSCNNIPVWKPNNTFFDDLLSSKAPQQALSWYTSLDQILSTFKFTQTQNVDSKNTKKIGYIKSIKPNYDNYALDIDYVEWINDNNAPNGYRINNPITTTEKFYTDVPGAEPKVTLQTYTLETDGQVKNESVTFSQFLDDFQKKPEKWTNTLFWIESTNGTVTSITEQYQP